MSNLKIVFDRPYLLLILIPAFLLVFIPYFRINKKYRKNRNRILSLIFHSIVMISATLIVSGTHIVYDTPISNNQVILLVDKSDSINDKDTMDYYVKSFIDGADDKFELGIITFGYDQVYASEIKRNKKNTFNEYLESESPDTSASDIKAALKFAETKFINAESKKIILFTDGIETDESCESVIKELLVNDIMIDTVYIEPLKNNEVEVVDCILPDENIALNVAYSLELKVKSNYKGSGYITLYDNDYAILASQMEFVEGENNFIINNVKFENIGLHKLSFKIEGGGDTLLENNTYLTYLNLIKFDSILLIENSENDSWYVKDLLEDEGYTVTTINVNEGENVFPKTVDVLRNYDEVLLSNIKASDLPNDFELLLKEYVEVFGGGLFTFGGENTTDELGNTVTRAYNHKDMVGTTLQEMLPVQAVDYTPPIGVALIIDCSGSMGIKDELTGKTKITLAKEGAIACVNSLTDRDWVGVMSLSDSYEEQLSLTPMTRMSEIIQTIDGLSSSGGTVYSGAIKAAGESLKALTSVERKHIILVTDCEPADSYEEFLPLIELNAYNNITMSIVGVNVSGSSVYDYKIIAEEYGLGKFYDSSDNFTNIPKTMRDDLRLFMVEEYYDTEPFYPELNQFSKIYTEDVDTWPIFTGYYGTRLKPSAEALIKTDFFPIYAHWNYGNGHVGSFMSDLNGKWSELFISEPSAHNLLRNIISSLLPKDNIRKSSIDLNLTEENYMNNLSIYTKLDETDKIIVTDTLDDDVTTYELLGNENYSKLLLEIKEPGVHEINVKRVNELGETVDEVTLYKTLSYSKEYETFDNDGIKTLENVVSLSGGMIAKEAWEIYDTYKTTIHIDKNIDVLLAIIALSFLLLDIFIRKFKIKWIHEIIRDRKMKKEMRGE